MNLNEKMKTYKAILEKKQDKYYLEIQKYKKKYFWSKYKWYFYTSYTTNNINHMIKEAEHNEILIPNLKKIITNQWDKN
jgi:hypothetical protein